MSEPYCVMLRTQIDEDAVRAYLAAPPRPASAHDDWARCTGIIDVEGFEDDPEKWATWLAAIDRRLPGTHAECYQQLRRSVVAPPCFRFYYDRGLHELSQVSVLYSQGASELAYHLTVSRGIQDFMHGTQRGQVAVHDPFMGNGTPCVIELRPGASAVVAPTRDHEAGIARVVQEFLGPDLNILTALGGQLTEAERQRACRDELDAFLRRQPT